MKKRRPANAAFVLVLFAGCATTTTTYYRNALHPEYGQVQYDRDVYECRRENTGPVTSSYAYGYARVAGSDSRLEVNEEMARQCLAARGWRAVSAPAAQSDAQSYTVSAPAAQRDAQGYTMFCGVGWQGNVPNDPQTTCLMKPMRLDEAEPSRSWQLVKHYTSMELCEDARRRSLATAPDAFARGVRCVYANDPRLR